MPRHVALVTFLLAAVAPGGAGAADEATLSTATTRAQRAIVEGRFCDAVHDLTFVAEHGGKPEGLFNAALAAEKAGDRARAAALYERFVEVAPLSKHRKKALAKAAAVRKAIARKGEGTPCPPPPEPAPPLAEANEPAPPATPEPAAANDRVLVAVGPDGPAETRPAPAPAPPPAASGAGTLRTVGWILLGVGSGAMMAGGGFTWSAAQDAEELESRAGAEPLAVFDAEARALEANYRQDATIGATGLIGGGALAGAGLLMILLAPEPAP